MGRGLTALVMMGAAACGRTDAATRRPTAQAVDSVVPREVALQRFRQGLDSVASLAGGAPSRDELVRRFVRALEQHDTSTIRVLVMSKAEFAWIYFPTNPQSLPPYDLSPDLFWFVLEGRSRQGIAAALETRAGRPLRVAGYSCDPVTSREGENTIHGPCTVRRVQAPGDTVTERLFGPIIERGGTWKFVSYANKL
jgi:hypothetical protein